ncbi:MAG: hypothetical protein F6K22_04335 [Okeania sp. SIO2F4]|nr:hypothetical protein [Okeania sp. SIO2F4]NES02129.1 hypothetical protein [Okeania sp. SIO2F4]
MQPTYSVGKLGSEINQSTQKSDNLFFAIPLIYSLDPPLNFIAFENSI